MTSDIDDVLLNPPQNPFVAAAIEKLSETAPAAYATLVAIDRVNDKYEADRDGKFNRLTDLQRRLADARLARDAYASDMQRLRHVSPDAERQLAKYESKVKGIQKEIQRVNGESITAPPSLEPIYEFFKNTRVTRWTDAPVAPTLKKGQSARDALAAKRGTIKEKKAERAAVQRAQIPLADAIERMEADVNSMGDDGRVRFERCLYRLPLPSGRYEDGDTDWPVDIEPLPEGGDITIQRGVSAMCFLFRDEVIAKGREILKAAAKKDRALSDTARAAKLAALDSEILVLEREEVALARMCGVPASSTSVEALLGITPRTGSDWLLNEPDDAHDDEPDEAELDRRDRADAEAQEARRRRAAKVIATRKAKKGDWLG